LAVLNDYYIVQIYAVLSWPYVIFGEPK
jgi:hypothetical protein